VAADIGQEVASLRFYTDEDVTDLLARSLRGRGFDVVSAHEAGLRGVSDAEQLAFAAQQGRAILTFNVRDFVALHQRFVDAGDAHAGIVVSTQIALPELMRRMVRLLNDLRGTDLHNRLEWLNNYR
jgi:uncharacterized protein with PIN domain